MLSHVCISGTVKTADATAMENYMNRLGNALE